MSTIPCCSPSYLPTSAQLVSICSPSAVLNLLFEQQLITRPRQLRLGCELFSVRAGKGRARPMGASAGHVAN
eukprot:4711543-Pleurochrysis_carterae.AAC.1